METLAEYLSRKAQELELLATGAAAAPARDPGLSGIAARKFELTRALRHAAAATNSFAPETNWSGGSSSQIADVTFGYGYQRFDLKIAAPSIYPNLAACNGEAGATTFFTCSGMAAGAVVLTALDHLLVSDAELWSLDDAYFETRHVADYYARRLKVRAGKTFKAIAGEESAQEAAVILHLDSIAAADWLPDLSDILCNRIVLALFDTTCYARTASRIAETVHLLGQRGISTVLIRSHLKLDSLGIEYGRLGSVVLRGSPHGSEARRGAIEGLGHILPDVIRTFGCAVSLASFLPLGQSREFLSLSARRAERAIENAAVLAQRLTEDLSGQRASIRTYHHGMFVTLHDENWLQPAPIRRLIDRALSRYRELGRNGFRATSFGFDFPVLTDVYDVPTRAFVLRIAPSDEPAAFMSELAGFVAQAWRELAAPAPEQEKSATE